MSRRGSLLDDNLSLLPPLSSAALITAPYIRAANAAGKLSLGSLGPLGCPAQTRPVLPTFIQ